MWIPNQNKWYCCYCILPHLCSGRIIFHEGVGQKTKPNTQSAILKKWRTFRDAKKNVFRTPTTSVSRRCQIIMSASREPEPTWFINFSLPAVPHLSPPGSLAPRPSSSSKLAVNSLGKAPRRLTIRTKPYTLVVEKEARSHLKKLIKGKRPGVTRWITVIFAFKIAMFSWASIYCSDSKWYA